MTTRDVPGVEDPSLDVVGSTPAPTPESVGPVPRRRSTRLRLAAAVGALALAGGAVLAEVAWSGDDTVLATPADRRIDEQPSAAVSPGPLRIDVEVPATVVAGRAAGFRVAWSDGDGVLAGSDEDWGDGVGASSMKERPCPAAAEPRPVRDTFRARHTWTEPGTYTVVIGVTTSTCASGVVMTEQAAKSFAVTVVAP
ncbi:MAG: hypothetical protein ACRDV1_04350 [Actinomycetes bacterium]